MAENNPQILKKKKKKDRLDYIKNLKFLNSKKALLQSEKRNDRLGKNICSIYDKVFIFLTCSFLKMDERQENVIGIQEALIILR